MSADSGETLTSLLSAHHRGDRQAFNRLAEIVYADLHRIARAQLGRQDGSPTLSATAIVHEAYVTLVDETGIPWQNRGHFFAVAARVMRRLVVDYARARGAQKRGGDARVIGIDDDIVGVAPDFDACLALDEFDEIVVVRDRPAPMPGDPDELQSPNCWFHSRGSRGHDVTLSMLPRKFCASVLRQHTATPDPSPHGHRCTVGADFSAVQVRESVRRRDTASRSCKACRSSSDNRASTSGYFA